MGVIGDTTVLLIRYGPPGTVDATFTCDLGATAGFLLRIGDSILVYGMAGRSFQPRPVRPGSCSAPPLRAAARRRYHAPFGPRGAGSPSNLLRRKAPR